MPKFSTEFWVGSGLAVVVAIIAAGIAVAVDARTKGEYRFVVTCFCVSWLVTVATAGIWYSHSPMAVWRRSILGFVVLAIVSVALFKSLEWASARHESASAEESSAKQNGALSCQVATVLLGPMFRFFQSPLYIFNS